LLRAAKNGGSHQSEDRFQGLGILDDKGGKPGYEQESQRARSIVLFNQQFIREMASQYQVPAEAIAGAIIWEADNNPRTLWRRIGHLLGLAQGGTIGNIHLRGSHFFEKQEAEKVEEEHRVPHKTRNDAERRALLNEARPAITYIAAIMRRHADNYVRIAQFDLTRDLEDEQDKIGTICFLYHAGLSEDRATRFKARRQTNRQERPNWRQNSDLANWVVGHLSFIRALLSSVVGDFPRGFGDQTTA
jgi:hypothetical protein